VRAKKIIVLVPSSPSLPLSTFFRGCLFSYVVLGFLAEGVRLTTHFILLSIVQAIIATGPPKVFRP
jgi:hypothetical protein